MELSSHLATVAGRAQSKLKAIALMMTKSSSSTVVMDVPVVLGRAYFLTKNSPPL